MYDQLNFFSKESEKFLINLYDAKKKNVYYFINKDTKKILTIFSLGLNFFIGAENDLVYFPLDSGKT